MKILRIIFGGFLIFSFFYTSVFGISSIGKEYELPSPSEYSDIITLWHIDSFEGGTGSRKQYLMKVAREFEKNNSGILVMPVSHTINSANLAIKNGEFPDMISYGLGVNLCNFNKLYVKANCYAGRIDNDTYAVSWCRGGYILIAKGENDFNFTDNGINNLMVSQSEYTQPITALALEGISAKNYKVLQPLDAYVEFLNGGYDYLLGTQRDVVRFQNRHINISVYPLKIFNDLFQYISIISQNESAKIYCNKFIELLISEKYQKNLSEICMMSNEYVVSFENSHLQEMQDISDFKSFSFAISGSLIKEFQNEAESIISNEKTVLDKIKNLLI